MNGLKKWSYCGMALFMMAANTEAGSPVKRICQPRIGTISQLESRGLAGTLEDRMRRLEKSVAQAALSEPDLVLLPEACLAGLGKLNDAESFVHRGDKFYKSFQQLAKKHKIYLAASITIENSDKTRTNSTLVFNPDGKEEYVYSKSYLTRAELKAGMVPGSPLQKCWDAPWGKTAFAICFDLNFDPLFENYKKQKAQLILFSSYFPGGMGLRQRAFNLRAFAVSSHSQGFESVFVDRAGREFARTNMLQTVVVKKLNLNSMVIKYSPADFEKALAKYGKKIEIESLRPEGYSIISILDLQKDVIDVMKEFNLRELEEFFKECNRNNDAARKK